LDRSSGIAAGSATESGATAGPSDRWNAGITLSRIRRLPTRSARGLADPREMTATAPRFKLTAPTVTETQIHEAVADALRILVLPPCEWTCFAAGHVQLPPSAAAALYRAGLKRGWPDFICLHDERIYGIELKIPGAKLSKTRTVRTRRGTLRLVEGQEDVHPRLQAAGMTIGLARSVDEVICLLRAWRIPMREGGAALAAEMVALAMVVVGVKGFAPIAPSYDRTFSA
jgi:hypothetical protein